MCWLKYQGTWTEQRVSKFWLHEDMQHLHSGGMLSLKSASFLYTFLDLFHSPEPYKLSISLHINCKRAYKMVFNYVLCLLFDLYFFSFSCGILPLSAAAATFRNYFVKLYATGVYKGNEPHGQVRNDVDMVRVLSVQANSSKEAAVKGVHMEVNHGVSCRPDSVSCHIKIHTAVSKPAEDKSTSVQGSRVEFKHPPLVDLLSNTAMILDPWT